MFVIGLSWERKDKKSKCIRDVLFEKRISDFVVFDFDLYSGDDDHSESYFLWNGLKWYFGNVEIDLFLDPWISKKIRNYFYTCVIYNTWRYLENDSNMWPFFWIPAPVQIWKKKRNDFQKEAGLKCALLTDLKLLPRQSWRRLLTLKNVPKK